MKWRKSFDPEIILSEIRKNRRISSGTVSYEGFDYKDWVSILITAIQFDDSSSWAFRKRVVHKVLWSPRLPENFSLKQFVSAYNQEKNKATSEMRKYRAVFEVSNAAILSGKRFSWGGAVVKFDPKSSSRFTQAALSERSNLEIEHPKLFLGKKRVDCILTTVSVDGISPQDAMERAIRIVKVLLGLVNFLFNGGKRSRIIQTYPSAISDFLLYPFMTIHNGDGGLAVKTIWYEAWQEPTRRASRRTRDREYMERNLTTCWPRIKKIPWRDQVSDTLCAYYDAFSDPNLENSFVEGWRLLERVAGDRNTKSDTLISRASFFYASEWRMDQISVHLRERRNLISHGRRIEGGDNDELAHQMHQLVWEILRHYLLNPLSFTSLPDLWSFADLPTDKTLISQRLRQLERLKSFVAN